jgi:outer membrane protein assembly factor BamB
MQCSRSLLVLPLMVVLLLMAGCEPANWEWLAQERDPTPTPRAPNVTPTPTPEVRPTVVPVQAIPPEVEQFAAEWPMANKDYANTRATFDSRINSENVHELGVAWAFAIPGASKWGSAATNPLVVNGIVYFQSLMTDVYALDLEKGALIWKKIYGESAFGPNGPALGWGKLFIQNGEKHLIALDMEDGRELWKTELEGPGGAQQPLAYGGYVYTGVGAGALEEGPGDALGMKLNAAGTSGHIYGIDQETGTIIWSFQTVEEGFWGHPELNSGAGVWFPPAIDTETHMTFWATGNPSPFPGTKDWPNASSRPGPNLYSNTLLAHDGVTGEMIWYNQVWPRDIFNYDFQNPPILAVAQIDGEDRPIVIGTGKMGRVYGFDRATGDLLWETPVGLHENDELPELPLGEVVTVLPGMWGGIETPAATADGVVYVITLNLPSDYTATAFDAEDGNEAVDNIEGRIVYDEGHSELVALDISNGEILWSIMLEHVGFGATTVVNDLVFTATYDGMIYAVNRADGSIVWTYQAPGGIIAWPAVVEDAIVWPIGLGRQPVLLTLRLGAEGVMPLPAARSTPMP